MQFRVSILRGIPIYISILIYILCAYYNQYICTSHLNLHERKHTIDIQAI